MDYTEKNIQIKGNFITLGQFLKLADVIFSGGEAKVFLKREEVYVNDALEERRGRKLYKGDKVQVQDKLFVIC